MRARPAGGSAEAPMPKPVCVPCGRFMRPKKNGVRWMEGKPLVDRAPPGREGAGCWDDYKLWMGDAWHCLGCGAEIVVGHGQQPLAEHYQADFERKKALAQPLHVFVADC